MVPKVLPEIKTLKAKLERGAKGSHPSPVTKPSFCSYIIYRHTCHCLSSVKQFEKYKKCKQCTTVQAVYSAVLPPFPMVFYFSCQYIFIFDYFHLGWPRLRQTSHIQLGFRSRRRKRDNMCYFHLWRNATQGWVLLPMTLEAQKIFRIWTTVRDFLCCSHISSWITRIWVERATALRTWVNSCPW